ncbi:MAG: hypothetical protein UX85_C0001G0214 [Candidatus Beckwithbacteria bacterium GW2011_GWB1_47_15]|uniref:DUF4446 domain-containing protein n=1 Tax=Candidatus Beckwithbacteria bacterium GW2011_GWB1_47_15 TaxID=1618371 RepID=A0A0G1UWB5_9BACT|nr:MAG: hypothetical protein UY43_C0001G0911 [Candidatus Beckwithbacteria bacterium GW2011_GWC1_49_16]AQS30851.1 hypothetical protein [uncultured bacterium]KKU36036.1 MAG: hypothetical protein UX50_C0001G0213 [Candidatus Beckwithbacteria bacterium GW2011_GWA1_46_30]KKU62000.1 MAG: hypothetical protein UX85_C0001G0214 [Candidatus Beckwithbacteria bacterium GW2011_GWB1_47_15]KKU72446.1 MAG: hypothetical protein UX97_C0001G0316 [Candidatus Beckwithbacteria bacterium GW2011_GWA2_47_25]KKW04387.1 M
MVLNPEIIQWLALALLVWVIILTALIFQSSLHYKKLTKNVSQKDLKTVLSSIMTQLNQNQKQVEELQGQIAAQQKKLKTHIQKVGFVRFNPFPATGGDQSFCLALLDANDTGFVLSSLHSRDTTRFYAKAVKNGEGSGYELSKEEKRAIEDAK